MTQGRAIRDYLVARPFFISLGEWPVAQGFAGRPAAFDPGSTMPGYPSHQGVLP